MSDGLIRALIETRNEWFQKVSGIEDVYGTEAPAVKAFHVCIRDLGHVIRDYGGNPDE